MKKRKDHRVVIHFVRPLAKLPRHLSPASQPLARPPVSLSLCCLRKHVIAVPWVISIEASPASCQGEQIVRAKDGFISCIAMLPGGLTVDAMIGLRLLLCQRFRG
jgi:hypothetical protein